MEIVARVGRLAAYFDQSINDLMAAHGLSRSHWDVLASLRRAGAPYQLSPTELYRGLMRTSGTMTNRLHRLEEAGLIRRAADPGDGRGLLVRLTPQGRRLVDRVGALHMANEARMINALSAEQREQLAEYLRVLTRWFEQHDATPPRQAPPRRSATRPGR